MTSSVSEPLKILSSSKEAHAHGEPGSVPAQEIKLSDEKIDALTWLVEQLSNSVSETRNRQTRLAKVLEQSLMSMGQSLAASEARLEKMLDERLGHFEQMRAAEAEETGSPLSALSAQIDATREHNDRALCEFRASLEAMERTQALSEARVAEKLDESLSRLAQEQGRTPEASDETLGALSARLDVESERNENALSDLHAAMTAMERTLANSEARVEEVLDNRLSRFEQARDKISKAGDDRLKALGAKLDSESARNEEELSNLRALLEAMERTIASSEARVEENIGERLDHLEQAQGDIAGASEDTLKALAARFEAEAEQNTHTLSNFRASLQAMEGSLAKLELQIEDAMKGGPSLYDQAKKKEAEALRGVVEDLMEQGSIRQAIEMHWNKKEP